MKQLLVLLAGLLLSVSAEASETIKVFILAGQSNMEGKAQLPLMEHVATQPATAERFAHLRDGDGWGVRDDVWIDFLGRKGPLTVGYGSRNRVGVELDFGHVVGDHFEEPVLLIKAAWGGRSLYRDFRPPSAGLPGAETLDLLLKGEQKKNPERTMEEVKASFGRDYRGMLREVERAMKEARGAFPAMGEGAFELSGFVWFQGWNDLVNEAAVADYERNLTCLIRDVRRDLRAPDLPFVVGQLGVGGVGRPDSKRRRPLRRGFLRTSRIPGWWPRTSSGTSVPRRSSTRAGETTSRSGRRSAPTSPSTIWGARSRSATSAGPSGKRSSSSTRRGVAERTESSASGFGQRKRPGPDRGIQPGPS